MSTFVPIDTVPSRGSSSPSIALRIVDLPAPLGPISASFCPRSTTRLTSRTEDGRVVVAELDGVDLDDDPGGPLGLGRARSGASSSARFGDLDAFELLERLDPALDLAGLGGLVAEPLDEPLACTR